MKRENRFAVIGAVLLATVFMWAAAKVFLRASPVLVGGAKKRLTFAHYLVYESNRKFYDEIFREYERLHPDVEIHQIDVPPPVWPAWRQTRFTGATAPDIIQLGRGITDEQCALYLVPLTESLREPNPYNRGTDLERVPWRETFVDGLDGSPDTLRAQLMDYYGVSSYLNIERFYLNLDLYDKITGGAPLPRSYEEFVALCERTLTYARDQGTQLEPIAGSLEFMRNFFDRAAAQQTQRLARRIDLERDGFVHNKHREIALGRLRREWDFDEPGVRDAFGIIRDIGRFFQSGSLSASRDEAGFLFKQGRTLMIFSGSWDANYFMSDTTFRVGALPLHLPRPGAARFGRSALGSLTELASVPSGGFAVTKNSRHPEVALDFLRFYTSRAVNQKFANDCLRVPVIVGATTPKEIAAFAPDASGYAWGFTLSGSLRAEGWGSLATMRLFQTSVDRLMSGTGSVEDFVARFGGGYIAAIRQDLQATAREGTRAQQRTDAMIFGLTQIASAPERERLSRIEENQTLQEAEIYQTRLVLAQSARD